MNLVTLGNATYKIGRFLSEFGAYNHIHIDNSERESDIPISIKEYDFDKYELNTEFDAHENINYGEETVAILNGASDISATLLMFLSDFKKNEANIRIIFIRPDLNFCSKNQILQSKIIFTALQEYARSGAIEELILIDINSVEKIIGEVGVLEYYDVVDKFISNMIHNWFWTTNNVPKMDVSSKGLETTRISTLATFSENMDIMMLYPLSFIEENITYPLEIESCFLMTEEEAKTGKTLKDIKEVMLEIKEEKFNGALIGYKIFIADFNLSILKVKTSMIQP